MKFEWNIFRPISDIGNMKKEVIEDKNGEEKKAVKEEMKGTEEGEGGEDKERNWKPRTNERFEQVKSVYSSGGGEKKELRERKVTESTGPTTFMFTIVDHTGDGERMMEKRLELNRTVREVVKELCGGDGMDEEGVYIVQNGKTLGMGETLRRAGALSFTPLHVYRRRKFMIVVKSKEFGESGEVWVEAEERVGDVCSCIGKRVGVDESCVSVMYQGSRVGEDVKFGEMGISEGESVWVEVKGLVHVVVEYMGLEVPFTFSGETTAGGVASVIGESVGVYGEKIGVRIAGKDGGLLERGMSLEEAGVEDGMRLEIIDIES